MPSGKKKYVFKKGECELVITRVTPKIHSILISQKCRDCGKETGFGYYSDTGKPKKEKELRCKDCLEVALANAFKQDDSHTRRLSN